MTKNNAPISQLADVRVHTDDSGHQFSYAVVRHPAATGLVVHFSAFYSGRLATTRRYREALGGYFHRLRMLGTDTGRNWLFLCDQYGAEGDGCYYTGPAGDLFVERAMNQIILAVADEVGVPARDTVMVGSSMGATGALKFGIRMGVRGIVAIAPHIDLDICAETQNRWRHVAFICPDGDPMAPANYRYTRQIAAAVASVPTLPRLYVQTCEDDAGVYREQVLRLVEAWNAQGGLADLDVRPVGGHTSDWAPRSLILDVIGRMFAGDDIPVAAYQTEARFAGHRTRPPLWWRARGVAATTRNRLLRRARPQT